MNYLAHAFLSFDDEETMIGNFIADHIRMKQADHLPERIRRGVSLHRRIDHFTDSHPLFTKSKRHFYDGFERYSGVLMDIYYDHVLAKNFSKYSTVPLQEYTHNIYSTLQKNAQYLPESSKHFLQYAMNNNTFFEYSKIEGIELVLKHLSHRINHGIWLNESVPMFVKNEKAIEEDFFEFIEDLVKEVKAYV
jgi:acyl carrier protein phosphodiesterase